MIGKSRQIVEKFLRNRGFTSPDARRIMADQIVLTAAALLMGVLLFPITAWPLAFGAGTVIATINLWALARSIHRTMGNGFSGAYAMAHFAGFLLRFAGTGGILYLLLVRTDLPLVPLIAGLSSVVVWLSILGLSRAAGHSC